MPAFYKRIQVKNLDFLKAPGPVIIAMNHPNAFTDPILFTYLSYPLRLNYMARGDAFRPGIAAWLLEQIGIVPVFRIQDAGREGLKKNDDTYRRVNALLQQNRKVIVFAEGLCIQERRLRPLKKGVARMVFGAYDALNNDKLRILPVGVNYSRPDAFRSDAFYHIGEPVFVKDYIADYRQNPARAHKRLLEDLRPAMKSLITHIDQPQNDEVVYMAEELVKRDWLRSQGMDPCNLWHDFQVLTQITNKVNTAAIREPLLLEAFRTQARDYFTELKSRGLENWLLSPILNQGVTWSNLIFRILLLLTTLPLYLAGMAANLPPLWVTAKITSRLVKHREFFSSFAIGFAMVVFPVFYLAWFALFYSLAPSVLWPFAICAVLALCGAFCLHYHPYLLKTLRMARYLRKTGKLNGLRSRREALLAMINKF